MSRNSLTFCFLLLLAGLAGVFILIQKNRHEEQLSRERAQAAAWEHQLEDAANANAELREKAEAGARLEAKARKRAELMAQVESEGRRQAEEARKMAEAKARDEEEKRRSRIGELNERLQKEAEERKLAETSLAKLDQKIQALEDLQARSEEKLSDLAQARGLSKDESAGIDDLERARAELAAKDVEIRRLAEEQKRLRETYRDSLAQESRTSEKIIREAEGDGQGKNLLELIGGVLVKVGILPDADKKARKEEEAQSDVNE